MKSMFLLLVFAVMAIAGFGQILMGKCISLIKCGQTLMCPPKVGRLNNNCLGKEFGIAPGSFLLVST